MSNNENLEYIKQELSAQEKLLSGLFEGEKFVKKYKWILIGIGVVLVVWFVGVKVYEYYQHNQMIKTNEAYVRLGDATNPDPKDIEILKANPKLFALYEFRKAIREDDAQKLVELKSAFGILDDLALYQGASLKATQTQLQTYSLIQNAGMKDMALISEAYVLIKQGDFVNAKKLLDTVPAVSSANEYATLLKHYLITKVQ